MLSFTSKQRLHESKADQLADRIAETGSKAKVLSLDLKNKTVVLQGDYPDYLLARRVCETMGLRIQI